MTNPSSNPVDSLKSLLQTVEGRVQTFHDERRALIAQLEDMRRTID